MKQPRASRRIITSLGQMAILFVQFGILGIAAAQMAGLFGRFHFVLDLANHPQRQYLLTSLAALILFAVTRRWRWSGLALACVGWSAWLIVPLYIGSASRGHNQQGKTCRLLIANVLTSNRSSELVKNLIAHEEPDVIIIVEANGWWLEELSGLRESHPHGAGLPREDNFGIAVFSRNPMRNVEHKRFDSFGVPSIVGDVELNGHWLKLIATHPVPPVNPEYFRSRNLQMRALADFAASVDGPIVIGGDLNCTMWSPVFRNSLARSGLRNARQGFGMLSSWPTTFPELLRIPIDHCLHSGDVDVLDCRLGSPIGSDHMPLIVDLTIRK